MLILNKPIFKTSYLSLCALSICAIAIMPIKAYADDANGTDQLSSVSDIVTTSTASEEQQIADSQNTHPPLKLTPDKSEIIKINRPAASIIIGNPNHLTILADSSKRLVAVPRAPGATSFTILDKDGEVIMQRHAIIAAPKQEYLRIRKTCANSGDNNCQETSVFYCPDMCHELMMNTGNQNTSTGAAQQAGALAGTGTTNSDAQPQELTTEPGSE